jgi:hypothetical protein
MALQEEASSYRTHWKEIVEYVLPRRGKYLDAQSNDDLVAAGTKKHQKIMNGSAVQALKTLAGGLQGGLTSPSRPWFNLGLQDEKLAEFKPVREWLHKVRQAMLTILARSNFYGAIHYLYWELGGFGTAAMLMEEDLDKIIRCRPFTIGEYYLALNDRYEPCSMHRQFSMTAEQMQERFGKGSMKMDNLPKEVVNSLEQNRPDDRFEVQHCIEPNRNKKAGKSDYQGKEYKSIYYPVSGNEDIILRESGYESNPMIATRWEVNGVNTYGDSPTMDALGDIKQLQRMEEKGLMAVDKQVTPTMNGNIALKEEGATMVAGGVNWVDPAQGQQGFSPAYMVNTNLSHLDIRVQQCITRIRSFYFNDLFLSVLGTDKDMTAFEVAKRHEEKLMMLGPIIERQQSETQDKVLERLFVIMQNIPGMIPPVPKELQGMPLKIEYNGLLAQAQQMVATAPIQQLVGFTAQVAQAKMVADQAGIKKVDWDESIDQYATALGVPPACTKSDDEVQQMLAADKQQAMTMQMMNQAEPLTKAAKNVSETPIRGGDTTALDALLGAAGSVGAPPR